MIRKFATYLLLLVISFSVGFLQFGYHLCYQDGLHLFNHDCHTDHQAAVFTVNKSSSSVKRCCVNINHSLTDNKEGYHREPKKNKFQITDDCCIKEFFFFVNPLPEKLQTVVLPQPDQLEVLLDVAFNESINIYRAAYKKLNNINASIPILRKTSNEYCRYLNTWLI